MFPKLPRAAIRGTPLEMQSKRCAEDHRVSAGCTAVCCLVRGNEIVCDMCRSLQHLVVGKDLEADILSDLMGWSRSLTQDGQLRWIGPEKGVLAMACGAVINAVTAVSPSFHLCTPSPTLMVSNIRSNLPGHPA